MPEAIRYRASARMLSLQSLFTLSLTQNIKGFERKEPTPLGSINDSRSSKAVITTMEPV